MNGSPQAAVAIPFHGRLRSDSALRAGALSLAPAVTPLRPEDRDSYAVTAIADITDRSLHAAAARFTAGLSPSSVAQAYLDWLMHLIYSPGKQLQLVDKAIRKAVRFANYAARYPLEDKGS
jgi:polyhydroxyalkanoate synthase